MAKYIPTEEEQKAMQWCIKNDIKVAVLPTKFGLKVDINNRGKKTVSPNTYTNAEALKKCWELYLYIYKKYWYV